MKKIIKLSFFISVFLFAFITHISDAQNSGAYLIPRTVYVGDPAVLVLPLPGSVHDMIDIVLSEQTLAVLSNDYIDFHRIVLEQRITGSRLLIEFSAFVPGIVEFPMISIGNNNFSGLFANIGSIINSTGSGYVLSKPASSLAMPGTAFIIYMIMTGFVLLFLFVLWFIFKGHIYIKILAEKWKQWMLFYSVRNTERHLYKALLKGADKREILDKLSMEFRVFLSFFTGFNCRAMTAGEFTRQEFFNPLFLNEFFRRCDELRFSGSETNKDDIFRLLSDFRNFTDEIEKAGKEKPMEENAA